MGRLQKTVRVTWPRFKVYTMPDLQLSGVPPRDPGVKLTKHFASSAWLVNWKKRQASLLSHPPTGNQQDYLLYVILDNLCERSSEEDNQPQPRPSLQASIFPFPPTVGIASCRCLIRFLSGMGDFGRVNAHRPRWSSFPGLRESNTHKRACLFCWARSRKLIEDSEWHSVFSCPVGSACRQRFQLALSECRSISESIEQPKDIFEIPSKSSRLIVFPILQTLHA